jgi:hypothetical protein
VTTSRSRARQAPSSGAFRPSRAHRRISTTRDDAIVLAYRVEEPGNIGIQNVVHLSAVDPDMERVQRIVLAAARAKNP